MPEWQIERGIGEDRALLMDGDRVLAAKLRWPDELNAGNILEGRLVSRAAGSTRGTVRTEAGIDVLVDRLPASATEGSALPLTIVRAAIAERGRTKLALARVTGSAPMARDPFAYAKPVRRLPPGAWEEVWTAAAERALAFTGGTLLFDVTPGMTVIDIDGTLPSRELALAAVPALADALRRLDLGGSIAIDFPTLSTKADRQGVDAALGDALDGWPHERTAMNGFGLVQIVARLEGPSILHRLTLRRADAAARFLLRQAEALDGAGAILLTAHAATLAAMHAEWLAELARRTGRDVRTAADPALAIAGGHAQIVPR